MIRKILAASALLMAAAGCEKNTDSSQIMHSLKTGQLGCLKIMASTVVMHDSFGLLQIYRFKTDASIAVDLSKRETELLPDGTLLIKLPRPQCISGGIDHSPEEVIEISKMRIIPQSLMHEADRKCRTMAQEKILEAADSENMISVARRQAEASLRSIYAAAGINIAVEWDD